MNLPLQLYATSATLNEISTTLSMVTDELEDELNFIEKNLKGSTNYLKRAKSFLLIYHLLYKNIADLQEEVNALEEASL